MTDPLVGLCLWCFANARWAGPTDWNPECLAGPGPAGHVRKEKYLPSKCIAAGKTAVAGLDLIRPISVVPGS